MESLRFPVCVILVFGNTMTLIEAGPSIRNIFDIDQPEQRNNRLSHSFLLPLNGNYQGSRLHHFNERNPVKAKTWPDMGSSSPLPIIPNLFNDLPKTTPHYDAIVVKSIPEATTTLDNVKILSRFNDDYENEDEASDKVTSKPLDSGDHTESNTIDIREKVTEKTTTDDITGAITKKHFYFQVQPVKPEGESYITNETVYYID